MGSLIGKVRRLIGRRHFYLAKLIKPKVPVPPIVSLPDGFTVRTIADTGLRVIDNFLTADEAGYLIRGAKNEGLERSTVVIQGTSTGSEVSLGRTSSDMGYNLRDGDPVVHSVVGRAGMLLGVPANHVERLLVTRYEAGEFYAGHLDYSADFLSDRMYTVLIYLNDLTPEQEGGTFFEKLNVVAQPKMGRAVCWLNRNPDGQGHPETVHSALPPVGDDTEKWVIQLWFRAYPASGSRRFEPEAPAPGQPVAADSALPAGLWVPPEGYREKVFGKETY